MKKRIVFCFDGTWNRLSADNPTNVVLLSQMVKPIATDGTPQIVYYDEGIGTNRTWPRRLWDGAFGKGMLSILREAYRILIFNYEPGDELFVFGFSRGAYTARSFIGFVRHIGILDVISASQIDKAIDIYRHAPAGIMGEESSMAMRFRARNCRSVCVSEIDRKFRLRIDPNFAPDTPLLDKRYLGVWDTVRALGVPDFVPFSEWINRRYGYHDAILTSKIKSARHAVALDEKRLTFPATLFGREKVTELNQRVAGDAGNSFEAWQAPYQEQWFPGVHGAVGGGGKYRGLSDAALHWILSGARRAGLELRGGETSVVFDIQPDPFDELFNDPPKWTKRLQAWFHWLFRISRKGPSNADEISLTTYRRVHHSPTDRPYTPRALRHASAALEAWPYKSPPEWKGAGPVTLEEHEMARRETLSIMARDRLGDPLRWRELFELNRDRIDDPDYLPTAVKLRMPAPPKDAGATT